MHYMHRTQCNVFDRQIFYGGGQPRQYPVQRILSYDSTLDLISTWKDHLQGLNIIISLLNIYYTSKIR